MFRTDQPWVEVGYDYTFLCALHPTMRGDWARTWGKLIKPGGCLVTLEFPIRPDDKTGPPWPVSHQIYTDLLGPLGASPSHLCLRLLIKAITVLVADNSAVDDLPEVQTCTCCTSSSVGTVSAFCTSCSRCKPDVDCVHTGFQNVYYKEVELTDILAKVPGAQVLSCWQKV